MRDPGLVPDWLLLYFEARGKQGEVESRREGKDYKRKKKFNRDKICEIKDILNVSLHLKELQHGCQEDFISM